MFHQAEWVRVSIGAIISRLTGFVRPNAVPGSERYAAACIDLDSGVRVPIGARSPPMNTFDALSMSLMRKLMLVTS